MSRPSIPLEAPPQRERPLWNLLDVLAYLGLVAALIWLLWL